MKDYLEKTLHQRITIDKVGYLKDSMPLAFKGRYEFYKVNSITYPWIIIKPKNDIGLVMIRKDYLVIQNTYALPCAFYFDSLTFYIKEKLVEENISFVVKDKQIYLPFLGMVFTNRNDREIIPIRQISFLTQKLILVAIYERWDNVTVSEASNILSVTKTSITRCFDEIEYLNINILNMKNKSRVITIPSDIKSLWSCIYGLLRNPIITKYEFEKDLSFTNKAGVSALSEYSLLSDNKYPTYAITKKELNETQIKKMEQVHRNQQIGCVVLELGYFINFNNKNIMDPLSIALSFKNENMQDERIITSLEKMLNEYVW